MGYLRHTPYIKEVRGFAPYDRCRSIKIYGWFFGGLIRKLYLCNRKPHSNITPLMEEVA